MGPEKRLIVKASGILYTVTNFMVHQIARGCAVVIIVFFREWNEVSQILYHSALLVTFIDCHFPFFILKIPFLFFFFFSNKT